MLGLGSFNNAEQFCGGVKVGGHSNSSFELVFLLFGLQHRLTQMNIQAVKTKEKKGYAFQRQFNEKLRSRQATSQLLFSLASQCCMSKLLQAIDNSADPT